MSPATPGASLPAAEDYARGRFFAWRRFHQQEADDPSVVWAAAWRQGAWDALRRSAQLADLIPRLEELIALYRNAEVEHEAENGSAYWHTTDADVADELGVHD